VKIRFRESKFRIRKVKHRICKAKIRIRKMKVHICKTMLRIRKAKTTAVKPAALHYAGFSGGGCNGYCHAWSD